VSVIDGDVWGWGHPDLIADVGRWNDQKIKRTGPPPKCNFNWNVITVEPVMNVLYRYFAYFVLFMPVVRIKAD